MKTFTATLLVITLTAASKDALCQLQNLTGNSNEILTKRSEVEIKGSPLLYEEWKLADFQTDRGTEYKGVAIRYNFFYDSVEFQAEIPGLNARDVVSFNFSGTEQRFAKGYKGIPKSSNRSFFEQLVVGRITLVKKYSSTISDLIVQGYGTATKRKEYFNSAAWFLIFPDGDAKEVSLNRKSITRSFPSNAKEVEAFIRSKKINTRNEKGLIEVVEYLNSLN